MTETKKCPFCAEEILAEAVVCKHCKRDLPKAVTKPNAPQKKQSAGCLGVLVATFGVLILCTFMAAACGALLGNYKTKQPQQAPQAPAESATEPVSAPIEEAPSKEEKPNSVAATEGAVAIVHAGALLADTEENYKSFLKTMSAKDTYGEAEFINAGKIAMLPGDAKVRVTGNDIWAGLAEVRIESGALEGKKVWLALEMLERK